VREDDVIAQVKNALQRISIKDPELMTAALAAVKDANKAKQETHNREVAALKKEHTDIQSRLDRLVDLLAEGVLPPDDYRVKREQYKARQHDLVNLIHAYDDADNTFSSTMEKLMKVAMGAHEGFMSSNVEQKRELLNFVFSNLSLKGKTLCYSYNFPFGHFENLDDCAKWRCAGEQLQTILYRRNYCHFIAFKEELYYCPHLPAQSDVWMI
jgi:site-specific DNA recombinase